MRCRCAFVTILFTKFSYLITTGTWYDCLICWHEYYSLIVRATAMLVCSQAPLASAAIGWRRWRESARARGRAFGEARPSGAWRSRAVAHAVRRASQVHHGRRGRDRIPVPAANAYVQAVAQQNGMSASADADHWPQLNLKMYTGRLWQVRSKFYFSQARPEKLTQFF